MKTLKRFKLLDKDVVQTDIIGKGQQKRIIGGGYDPGCYCWIYNMECMQIGVGECEVGIPWDECERLTYNVWIQYYPDGVTVHCT